MKLLEYYAFLLNTCFRGGFVVILFLLYCIVFFPLPIIPPIPFSTHCPSPTCFSFIQYQCLYMKNHGIISTATLFPFPLLFPSTYFSSIIFTLSRFTLFTFLSATHNSCCCSALVYVYLNKHIFKWILLPQHFHSQILILIHLLFPRADG